MMRIITKHWDRFKEAARFVLAGGLSFVLDFAILVLCQDVFGFKNIPNGIILSTAVAYSIAVVVHYFLSVVWVFRGHNIKSKNDHLKAGGLFYITCGIGFMLTELGMWTGVEFFGIGYVYVKIVVTGLVMVWNYMMQRFFVFSAQKRV